MASECASPRRLQRVSTLSAARIFGTASRAHDNVCDHPDFQRLAALDIANDRSPHPACRWAGNGVAAAVSRSRTTNANVDRIVALKRRADK